MTAKKPNGVDRAVGAAVKQLRLDRGLSQSALASALGVNHQRVSKMESGEERMSVGQLWTICQTLKVKPATIFDAVKQETT